MARTYFYLVCLVLVFNSCQKKDNKALTAFGVYCEMVANNAKPIAFHYPMETTEIDVLWNDFMAIAEEYNVQLYRETNLPSSLLFPKNVALDKEVVLIYKGKRLQQYQQWKADVLVSKTTDFKAQEKLARRLGRLLGYTNLGINELLRKNSKFRDIASSGVTAQTTHLFYENVQEARTFYKTVIGLPQKDSITFQISNDGFIALHPTDTIHLANEPKSSAIALLTDQLPQWYAHAKENNIQIKYTYKPKDGGAHDGFVAVDPGGYLLEFEEFKQHQENELFIAILGNAPRINTLANGLSFFGTITWTYHRDLLKMQEFYENTLGFELVADQGWTKIYQTAPYSFIGLVDERRGMEDYADQKAVELTWSLSEADTFKIYANENWEAFDPHQFFGPENYKYRITSDQ